MHNAQCTMSWNRCGRFVETSLLGDAGRDAPTARPQRGKPMNVSNVPVLPITKSISQWTGYPGNASASELEIGNIGTGNISTMATLNGRCWDGWNIIREIQWPVASGQWPVVTDNVWGLDLGGTLQGAGGVGGLLAVIKSDCTTTNSPTHQLFNSPTPNSSLVTRHSSLYFPTYDANGNISEYVATNGETVAHYDYSPFGETLMQTGDLAASFTHRFSTKPWCPVTGLCEYQMRKYRPEIGRWLSRDPIGEKDSLMPYCYLRNSAIVLIDNRGLASWLSTKNFKVSSIGCAEFELSVLFQLNSSDNIEANGTIVQNIVFDVAAYDCFGHPLNEDFGHNHYAEAFSSDGPEDIWTIYPENDSARCSYGKATWEGVATYYDKMPYYSIFDHSENPGWGVYWIIDPASNPMAGNLPYYPSPVFVRGAVSTAGLKRRLVFEWNCCNGRNFHSFTYLSISTWRRDPVEELKLIE